MASIIEQKLYHENYIVAIVYLYLKVSGLFKIFNYKHIQKEKNVITFLISSVLQMRLCLNIVTRVFAKNTCIEKRVRREHLIYT